MGMKAPVFEKVLQHTAACRPSEDVRNLLVTGNVPSGKQKNILKSVPSRTGLIVT
jgi:hypothetical protein